MNIGPTIKRLRRARGWTLKRLAAESRMTLNGVWGVESRQTNCSLRTAELLAGAFGLRLWQLIELAEFIEKPE